MREIIFPTPQPKEIELKVQTFEYLGFKIEASDGALEGGIILDIISGWRDDLEKIAIANELDGFCSHGVHLDNMHYADSLCGGRTISDLYKQVTDAIDLVMSTRK